PPTRLSEPQFGQSHPARMPGERREVGFRACQQSHTVGHQRPLAVAFFDRSEVDGAVVLFKAVLHELPQADSLYVGYDNGCWLQVRRLDVRDPTERQRLEAPPGAV
ncbi:MAG TPA: hypothetical protein VNU19_13185, partial [Candidatus Acidoferrum sp.]|nr:hypothetical protein [Candidatus Acidoferrum sp.]